MTFITEFLNLVGAWLSGFWGLVSDTLDGAIALFWDGTNITILGTLLLFGIAVGLVYMGLLYVQKLVRKG